MRSFFVLGLKLDFRGSYLRCSLGHGNTIAQAYNSVVLVLKRQQLLHQILCSLLKKKGYPTLCLLNTKGI